MIQDTFYYGVKMNCMLKYRFGSIAVFRQLFLVCCCVLAFFSYGNAIAGNLTLAWQPSTSSSVGGYKLYYGLSSHNYTSNADTGKLTSYTLNGLAEGATYFFAVTAYDLTKTVESGFSNEISVKITSPVALSANFTANTTSGVAPLSVAFTPVTTGVVNAWSWSFGDLNIPVSTSQTPTVVYSTPGIYDVSLTVGDANGNATLSKQGFITVTAPVAAPLANFSASPKTGNAPLNVAFTDSSTGNISNWTWNFGDGTTSAVKNPSHTYSAAGVYAVSLTVSGPDGSNTKTISGFVTVASPVVIGADTSKLALVAAYGFEETDRSNTADASGLGNHGKVRGAIRVSPGRYGKALQFDGLNDWVTINDSPSLDLSSGFTLEAWVNPTVMGYGSIVAKEKTNGTSYSLYSAHDADLPLASFDDNVTDQAISGKLALPINQWSHLVASYNNGGFIRLYVNSVLVAIRPQVGFINQSNHVLRIGGNGFLGDFFHGKIDEVRVYKRALTNHEIKNNYLTAVSVANPMQPVVGHSTILTTADYNPKGIAQAFRSVAPKNGLISQIRVYVDASTPELVAGIYQDNLGHPGELIAQGKVLNLTAGTWNKIPISNVAITANKPYWIAMLGTKGIIKYRDTLGAGNGAMETYSVGGLTALPKTWVTGKVYPGDGPISAYGAGYFGP